jgi:hypothetical protein
MKKHCSFENEKRLNTLGYRKIKFGIHNLLEKYCVPVELWGKGAHKSLDDLTREVFNQDSKLVIFDGELVRKLKCVDVEVLYSDNGRLLRLKETKQVFKNGSSRERGFRGISEKITTLEKPVQGTKRALKEELGLDERDTENNVEIEFLEEVFEQKNSPSYPGLTTHYTVYNMRAYLSENEFNPNGYVEKQENITTYFEWEEVGKNTSI